MSREKFKLKINLILLMILIWNIACRRNMPKQHFRKERCMVDLMDNLKSGWFIAMT